MSAFRCAANVREATAQNFLAGAIQQHHMTVGVGSDQAAAHRMNDVFGEILKIKQLLALFFEFAPFAAKRLNQQSGQISYRQKAKQVAEKPQTEQFRRGATNIGPRDLTFIGKQSQGAQQCHANSGGGKGGIAREQDSGDDNHQQVEGDEIAFLQAGGVHQGRNHQDITGNLRGAVPARFGQPANQYNVESRQSDPENDQGQEVAAGTREWQIGRPSHTNAKDQGNHQQADARQPIQPFPRGVALFHSDSTLYGDD